MASLFTRIIEGELPGRFVWREPEVVAFLTIAPITAGHTLVVPVAEIDHWIDVEDALLARLTSVARAVGRGQREAFGRRKVALLAAGLEVPHVHFHVFPIDSEGDISFSNADPHAPADRLDDAASRLRAALRSLGYDAVAD